MKIILHVGAHRTASSSFQSFLWVNRHRLAQSGLTCWTPRRTRDGLMAQMMRHPALISEADERLAQRSMGRVRIEARRLEKAGQRGLLVSDENITGSMMNNVADTRLYPLLRERMRRFADTFEGRDLTVALAIRSYDSYWTSLLVHAICRGRPQPSRDLLDYLVTQPRRWRTLVRDIAAAMPDARIVVWPYESFASRPAQLLADLWDQPTDPLDTAPFWQNSRADDRRLDEILTLRGEPPLRSSLHAVGQRWNPFSPDHMAVLRADYRQDLSWLRAGADGLATFIDGRKTPAQPPDRAIKQMVAGLSAADFGGRNDGIEKGTLERGMGRTGAG